MQHKVIVRSHMSNTGKYVSKKSLPNIMGLVIDRTKDCYVKIILSIIKSSVMTLFAKDFPSSQKYQFQMLFILHLSYEVLSHKFTKQCVAPVSISADR